MGVAGAPGASYIRKNLARTLMRRGNWEEARKHLEVVLRERPDDYAALRLSARTLRNLDEFDLALARLDRAARIRPTEASIYREMSIIYGIDLENPDAARRFAEKADRLEGDEPAPDPSTRDGEAI
jgi:Flp pilus assembly protein TadD